MMKVLAMYLRLSEDDGCSGESNSITNQRLLLKEYLDIKSEFFDYEIHEYYDDGYSGTNFNRPGITRLLGDVKKNVINCILVKDFSRFSRDYVEIGDYLNHIFPFWGIRFIAVNDNYDSDEHKGSTVEIDTAFKTLLNDFYSQDLSAKVKSAMRSRCENGEYVQGIPPIGYEKIPEQKNKIRTNEYAANIVRMIFELSASGRTPTQIARYLNEEGIPTALQLQGRKDKLGTGAYFWSVRVVKSILDNRFYVGEYVYNKLESVAVGSNKRRRLPESEWVTIVDHHEAIVSEELFQNARYMKHKHIRHGNAKKPLVGKIRCAGCGYSMRYSPTHGGGYSCSTQALRANEDCCKYIKAYVLEEMVLTMLTKELMKQLDLSESNKLVKESLRNRIVLLEEKIRAGHKKIRELEQESAMAYENYAMGDLGVGDYKRMSAENNEKICEIEGKITKYKDDIKKTEMACGEDSDELRRVLRYSGIDELIQEVVDDFVGKVVVYKSKMIEIDWTFASG